VKYTDINEDPNFQAVAKPLQNLRSEITSNRGRLEEIHVELLRLSADAKGKTAWSNYLHTTPDSVTTRSELRGEAQKIETRQQMLENALHEGNLQVDAMVGRLSRPLCEAARPPSVFKLKEFSQHLTKSTRPIVNWRRSDRKSKNSVTEPARSRQQSWTWVGVTNHIAPTSRPVIRS
jgi:hypothetical protein